MTIKKLPRFYLHKDALLGYVTDVPDLQSFRALVGRYYSDVYRGKTILFIPPDGNVYALVISTEWFPRPEYKINFCPVYKLCTRSSPQIKKEDLRTRPFTLPLPGTSQYFGSRDGLLVNNRRHVVMGNLINDGENKPTWLLEFELEWLFT